MAIVTSWFKSKKHYITSYASNNSNFTVTSRLFLNGIEEITINSFEWRQELIDYLNSFENITLLDVKIDEGDDREFNLINDTLYLDDEELVFTK